MKIRRYLYSLLAVVLFSVAFAGNVLSVSASSTYVEPRYNNVSGASISIDFEDGNVYVGVNVVPYSHGSGISGLVKLYDSTSSQEIAIWPVSDYERPIAVEFSYPGVKGRTYTAVFTGYAYSNNGTAADRLEMECSAKFK